MQIGLNATATAYGNINAVVFGVNKGEGTLVMSGTGAQTVIGIDDGDYLNRFTMDNATSVTVNNDFGVQNLNFTKDGVLNLQGPVTDIKGSITANNMGTISFSGGNARIKTDVGAANARLKEIKLGTGVNINIDAGKALYTTITGSGNNVTFAGASNSPGARFRKSWFKFRHSDLWRSYRS
ncbi:MAG UNVERIFIED_CONTAM: hypothetical protein LVQ98_00215 [Rickettsiaceae bacterium]